MTIHRRRGRPFAIAAALAALLVAATACAGSSGTGGDSGSDGEIELIVDTFGTFGYEDLYKQYEASHPNIKIRPRTVALLNDYTPRLQQWISTGSGAGDVVAIEEGILLDFTNQPDKFVNLFDYGAGALKGNFLDWKWQQGLSPDGKKLIGLGTDIGSIAMCYRKDLFERAGLPTDRDEVSKLWPTWEDYIATGKRYAAKEKGTAFVDSAADLYVTILRQLGDHSYFDRSNRLVVETNPAVKRAWDTAVEIGQAGLSARLTQFTDGWSAALRKGAFATIACPAWMLGTIEQDAGEAARGKWDVAAIPGGGGSHGGSFLAVPKQSKHPKEAAELVKFLTSPEGQIAAFKARNNLPSSPQALDSKAVRSFRNAYFSNAPVGRIFGDAAKGLEPVYLGPKNLPVQTAIQDDLRAVENGQLSPDAGWKKAVQDAEREAR